MPSYAEMASWKDRNSDEYARYLRAVAVLYGSTGDGSVDVQAAVDQTPAMVMTKTATRAILAGMGYGDAAVRALIVAKVVEMRLAE